MIGRKRSEAAPRCNICGHVGAFGPQAGHLGDLTLPPGSEWREGLACAGCGSICRDRALVHALGCLLHEREPLERWAPRPRLRVFETSGYRAHPPLLDDRFDYFNTTLLPSDDLPPTVDGRTTANLESLPYPDRFFDVVLSSEVLEHVGRLDEALAELHRVIGDDGHAVITVPYFHDWPRTSTRVYRWRDRDVLLYPPEYHAEDTLVYRLFGRDFLTMLSDRGFTVGYAKFSRPDLGIVDTEVVVATKAPYLDLTPFAG